MKKVTAFFGLALFLTLATSKVCYAEKEYYQGAATWVQVSEIQSTLNCQEAERDCCWIDDENQTFHVFDSPAAGGTSGTYGDVDVQYTASGISVVFTDVDFD